MSSSIDHLFEEMLGTDEPKKGEKEEANSESQKKFEKEVEKLKKEMKEEEAKRTQKRLEEEVAKLKKSLAKMKKEKKAEKRKIDNEMEEEKATVTNKIKKVQKVEEKEATDESKEEMEERKEKERIRKVLVDDEIYLNLEEEERMLYDPLKGQETEKFGFFESCLNRAKSKTEMESGSEMIKPKKPTNPFRLLKAEINSAEMDIVGRRGEEIPPEGKKLGNGWKSEGNGNEVVIKKLGEIRQMALSINEEVQNVLGLIEKKGENQHWQENGAWNRRGRGRGGSFYQHGRGNWQPRGRGHIHRADWTTPCTSRSMMNEWQ
ncbi:hypothetical protein niasHS_015549 [Heterodera schachtii]|uniref:Uncharacterized protein n=1 Tax=Heterodera schachtii TaxID=97005 RepID=A0ABD2I365_HETSC